MNKNTFFCQLLAIPRSLYYNSLSCWSRNYRTDGLCLFCSFLNRTRFGNCISHRPQSVSCTATGTIWSLLRADINHSPQDRPGFRWSLAPKPSAKNQTNPAPRVIQTPTIILTKQKIRGNIHQRNFPPTPDALGCTPRKHPGPAIIYDIHSRYPTV